MRPLVIGARGSRLSLQQSEGLQQALQAHHPELEVRIEVIRTTGDKIPATALPQFAASVKGLFVKEIEEALLQKKIDVAVHSLKDLPTELPDGLELASIPEREDPRDALVTTSPPIMSLDELPEGTKLGTGSLRRQVQLQHLRPDWIVMPIRGNVDTRIRKIQERGLDGIVLAAAGLRRLEMAEKISYTFTLDEMVPAIGQGALAVEIRSDDDETRHIVQPLDHPETRICALAERRFLHSMGGGCQVPLGAHARIINGSAIFSAFVGSPSSLESISKVSNGHPQQLDKLALDSAEFLLSHGADKILKEVEAQFPS
ncbi:MAG: hydroxymethylbilane synthase [Acidobacteriota bacterium]